MSGDCAIVILSYNRFATTTGPCLESLFADPQVAGMRIVVVDNASQDDSAQQLQRMVAGRDNVVLRIESVNHGFAGGNNLAVGLAAEPIVVLLNSDTIVPAGAMGRLSRTLADHPDWAMLGPVTNQAGNEQKIFTLPGDPAAIIEQGRNWCRHADGDCFASRRLDFFCVAIRRSLYLDIGGLDERFGVGYYEDTDFSLRVLKTGRAMMFTEDVFVYHQAGQSFAKMGTTRVRRIMRANRDTLVAKHGRQVPLVHLRDCNLAVIDAYLAAGAAGRAGTRRANLDYRFRGRMDLARTLFPRHPVRRWIYQWGLRRRERQWRKRKDEG